ncbi:tRNA-intron lyase [Candidatus Woesearchaeota archaeon]|jgi:tRNA-intron endonuclease|nr:tRNA-intron lyase [Candidatus Woesearchaeota archaeon]|tara:strand:+ start:188 stop:769 length:582 start_codon:yes stop_codon:yes gene_type:complete
MVKKVIKKKTIEKKKITKKELPKAVFSQERVLLDKSEESKELYDSGAFGKILEDKNLQIALQEALFLMEKKKILVIDGRNKNFTFKRFLKRANQIEPNFWIRYSVYKDMRNRGYIVKTALKFGADFRVYDRGIKPGEDHARWIIYPVHEGSTLTWYEFAAKNRVAHSTKKRLMMGVVDDEGDVTYWEIKWIRP